MRHIAQPTLAKPWKIEKKQTRCKCLLNIKNCVQQRRERRRRRRLNSRCLRFPEYCDEYENAEPQIRDFHNSLGHSATSRCPESQALKARPSPSHPCTRAEQICSSRSVSNRLTLNSMPPSRATYLFSLSLYPMFCKRGPPPKAPTRAASLALVAPHQRDGCSLPHNSKFTVQ